MRSDVGSDDQKLDLMQIAGGVRLTSVFDVGTLIGGRILMWGF